MERFTVTMYEEDIDYFERERTDLGYRLGESQGLTKSAFIRFLLHEHKETTPNFIKHKELIAQISNLNTSIKELILSDKINDVEKLHMYEKLNEINTTMKEILKK